MAKRVPFKYGRGTCIFCGRSPPEVKISKEHLFGDWLREVFPRTAETTHTLGSIEWPMGPAGDKPTVSVNEHGKGHSGSKKIRAVCRTCNEGWLSNNVEGVAKPILIPLIEGTEVAVSTDMQRILATWASKTAMVGDSVQPLKTVIHQSERTWLKENLAPPSGWNIWIGSYGGIGWRDLGMFQHAGKLAIPAINNGAPTEHNLELTLIGMRYLLFLVINTSWERIWDALDGMNTGFDFARIWPIRTANISWPRSQFMLDPAFRYFCNFLPRILQ